MHQTHVQSFLEGDGFSRRAQLHGAGLAYQARQSLGAAHARHHAEVDLGQPDFATFFLCNANVAGHGDFQPAADCVAIDGRDDNLGGVLKAHKHLVAMQSEVVLKGKRFAGQHVDIGAGGEKLFHLAGDHDGMNIVVKAGVEDRDVKFL